MKRTVSVPDRRPAPISSDLFKLGQSTPATFQLPNKEIGKARVDNQTVHWNCQDYVIEIVDKLVEECIIEEDCQEYTHVFQTARQLYACESQAARRHGS